MQFKTSSTWSDTCVVSTARLAGGGGGESDTRLLIFFPTRKEDLMAPAIGCDIRYADNL